MLHNRYFIAGMIVLLLAVLLYDLSYIRKRRAGARPPGPAAPTAVNVNARSVATARAAADYRPVWRRDPFQDATGPRQSRALPAGSRERSFGDELRLDGTVISNGKGYALINGGVFSVGDCVAGREIVRIDGLAVTVNDGAGTRILRILNAATEKE